MNNVRNSVLAAMMIIGAGVVSAQAAQGGNGNGNNGNGNGNGGSGGAPSPEINAMLGLTLAGGTLAFLRRRKSGKAQSAA